MATDPACSDPMCSYRAEMHRIPHLEARVAEAEGALRRIRDRFEAQNRLPAAQPVTPAEILGIVHGALKGEQLDRP